MDLEQQLKLLVEEAPQYGIPSPVMEQAVIPVLELFGKQLQYLEYYIIQSIDGDWLITTLSNRTQPEQQKRVIYGFATLKDAAQFQGTSDPKIIAKPMPATHILFQLFSLDRVDSIIFMDKPGDLNSGRELHRADLQNLIQNHLQQLGTSARSTSNNIPPDLA